MLRIIAIILVLIIGAGAYYWYSVQSLPDWYEQSESAETQTIEKLSEQIKNNGVNQFLGQKVGDVLDGQVVFSEAEFNALLLASLKLDEDGRKLLSVSDAVRATIHKNSIEIAAVINLDKVEKIDPKARKAVEKVNKIFPFLSDSRVAVAVFGKPVARNGAIGIKDDFHLKLGAIPISNSALRQLGAKVERANVTNLNLKYLSIKSVDLEKGKITLGVLPRF